MYRTFILLGFVDRWEVVGVLRGLKVDGGASLDSGPGESDAGSEAGVADRPLLRE